MCVRLWTAGYDWSSRLRNRGKLRSIAGGVLLAAVSGTTGEQGLTVTTTTIQAGSTIAVWGHYHGGNLGDDLVVATIVSAIRRRVDDARVVGISLAPADARIRHGIEAYPINPRLPNVVPRTATGNMALRMLVMQKF